MRTNPIIRCLGRIGWAVLLAASALSAIILAMLASIAGGKVNAPRD